MLGQRVAMIKTTTWHRNLDSKQTARKLWPWKYTKDEATCGGHTHKHSSRDVNEKRTIKEIKGRDIGTFWPHLKGIALV